MNKYFAKRKKRGKIFYLVKWLGYPDHENSWEPAKNLKNAQQKIQDFKASGRQSA